MTDTPTPTCAACRFSHDNAGRHRLTGLCCRRYPPPYNAGDVDLHPPVSADGWCGEWQAKPPPDGA